MPERIEDRGLAAPPTKPSGAEKRNWPGLPPIETADLDAWMDGLLNDNSPSEEEAHLMHLCCGIYSYEEMAHCLAVLKKRDDARDAERRGS